MIKDKMFIADSSAPLAVNPMLAVRAVSENETVINVNRICELCGSVVDMYDTFTEEEHCKKCGWQ